MHSIKYNGSTNGNDSNAATTETRVPGKWHPVNAFDFFGQLAAAIRRQILPSLARVRVAFDSEALFSVAFNSLWKLVVTSVLHTSLCLQPYPLHLSISTLQEITEHANERKSLETALGGCVRALLAAHKARATFFLCSDYVVGLEAAKSTRVPQLVTILRQFRY